jgi:GlcNAc-P-P-Und epimerase
MIALITGGSGFVGQKLAAVLAAQGSTLRNLDMHASADPLFAAILRGDVRDRSAFDAILPGCTHVFHLAAAHHDRGISEETYFAVNRDAAKTLCEACDANGIREICFLSSVAVYGNGSGEHNESDETRPENPYGASKLATEEVLSAWTAKGDGRRVLVIRPSVVFGPDNFANMFALIRQIAAGRFLQVGEGRNVKSMVYVDNLVDAVMHLMARPDRAAFEVFNVADKPDLTSAEIAGSIYAALGKRVPSAHIPLPLAVALARPFDVLATITGRNVAISSARVRKLAEATTRFPADRLLGTGFKPRVSLREGIERMVRWYIEEGRMREPVRRLPPATPVAPPTWITR